MNSVNSSPVELHAFDCDAIIAVNTTSARVADLKKDKMERLDGV